MPKSLADATWTCAIIVGVFLTLPADDVTVTCMNEVWNLPLAYACGYVTIAPLTY